MIRRLAALMRKEFAQILRDPSALAIAFVLPLVLLFLFGYGVSLDPRGVRLAIVVPVNAAAADSFVGGFVRNPWFAPTVHQDRQSAEAALRRGEVKGIVALHEDFEARLSGRAPGPAVQLVLDGTDANTARLVQGYVERLWADWLALRSAEARSVPSARIELVPRIRFNPEVRSESFLIPGVLAVIMTLTGALLTALLVAREHDRGTIETLLATPARRGEIMIAKIAPGFVLGLAALAVSAGLAILVFDVAPRGSAGALLAVGAAFLLAALGMGLLISAATRDQFVAGQMAIMVTFLPSFLLSGFIFEIGAMPGWTQALSTIVAARYLVSSLQTIFLVGDVWAIILRDIATLLAMAAVFLGLAYAALGRRLE